MSVRRGAVWLKQALPEERGLRPCKKQEVMAGVSQGGDVTCAGPAAAGPSQTVLVQMRGGWLGAQARFPPCT